MSHVDVGQVTMINPDHYNKELSFNIYDNDTNDNLYSTRVPVNDVSVDIDSSISSIRLAIYGWQTVLYNIVIS